MYPSSISPSNGCPHSAHHNTSHGGIPPNNNNFHYTKQQPTVECKCETNTQSPQTEENNKCQQKVKSFEYELANGVAALISQSSILCLNCGKNLLKQSSQKQSIEPVNKMSATGRDRLGFWGTSGDNEVPGSLSGQDRLHKKRYNKVSLWKIFNPFHDYTYVLSSQQLMMIMRYTFDAIRCNFFCVCRLVYRYFS